MPKSATDLMHEIIFSAVVDAVSSLKDASGGVPNSLLRDINAIHANSTFVDMPAPLQAAITASVRAGFNRLMKEGYSVSPSQPGQGIAPRFSAGKPVADSRTSNPRPRPAPGPRRRPTRPK